MGLAASLLPAPRPALADDCLLDRNNNGNVDAGTDSDGSANSDNDDTSTACGVSATATGSFATAIGSFSNATADRTIVLGQIPGGNSGLGYTQVVNGTPDPLAPLHLFRDDATQEMLFLESNEAGTVQDRAMMSLANNGGIRFEFANNSLATAWRFQAATGNQDRFEVTKVGTGQIEFWVDDLGNGFIAGDLDVGGNLRTNVLLPSDRDLKTKVEVIDPETVLDKVARLPMNAWEYTGRPGERHIGPMAQDFRAAFGPGRDDTSISVVDASGVALASTHALKKRNAQLEAGTADPRQQLAAMREALDQVKALMMQLLPQTAQHSPGPHASTQIQPGIGRGRRGRTYSFTTRTLRPSTVLETSSRRKLSEVRSLLTSTSSQSSRSMP